MPESGQKQLLMLDEVLYGTTPLEFTIARSVRKTLAIEVHPDTSIHVIAPVKSSIEAIREKVLKRGSWIVKQQLYFEQFLPRTPEREYVSGESHFYLGRKYLLKIRKATNQEVKLKGGELLVYIPDTENKTSIKRQLGGWYHNHAQKRFNLCLKASLKKFLKYELPEPPMLIKRMNKRWGSCTPNGVIILNPEIIKAPSKCIEYVITHELCHLIHPNHSRGFYTLQSEMMPEWERWKLRLEKVLV